MMRLPEGVTLMNASDIMLQCEICKQQWSPRILPGGKLARGSKRCPNGCTQRLQVAHDEQAKKMERFEQSFNLELRSRLRSDLAQAHQDLAFAQEQGHAKDIREHESTIITLQAQLDHLGEVVIDGSVGFLALPEGLALPEEHSHG